MGRRIAVDADAGLVLESDAVTDRGRLGVRVGLDHGLGRTQDMRRDQLKQNSGLDSDPATDLDGVDHRFKVVPDDEVGVGIRLTDVLKAGLVHGLGIGVGVEIGVGVSHGLGLRLDHDSEADAAVY